MINGLAQQYLLDLIQPYISNKHAYTGNLRSYGKFYCPQRTTSYYTSLISSTIKLWKLKLWNKIYPKHAKTKVMAVGEKISYVNYGRELAI